jgi:acetyltransferase-like isoleucine patch superfamily enzyme
MRPDTYIGDNCKVGHHTVFEGACSIGNNTLIQAQSNITRGVIIGDRVFIGMQFCGGNDKEIVHERWDRYGEFHPDPYRIEDFARIGFGVHILPGVVIKRNAFVAAGSLVTKDVAENIKVKGRPAKIYGMVDQEYRL